MYFELWVDSDSTERSVGLNYKPPIICFVLLIFRTLACFLALLRSFTFKLVLSSPYHLLFLSFTFHGNHACMDTPPTHTHTHRHTRLYSIVKTRLEDTKIDSFYIVLEIEFSEFGRRYPFLSFAHSFPVDLEEM